MQEVPGPVLPDQPSRGQETAGLHGRCTETDGLGLQPLQRYLNIETRSFTLRIKCLQNKSFYIRWPQKEHLK